MSPIRHTWSPAHLLPEQPETRRTPRAEERREQSAVSSCAQLLCNGRMPQRVGTLPQNWSRARSGRLTWPFYTRTVSTVCDACHSKRRVSCSAGAAFVNLELRRYFTHPKEEDVKERNLPLAPLEICWWLTSSPAPSWRVSGFAVSGRRVFPQRRPRMPASLM